MEYERKAEPIGRELVRRLLPRRDPEGHKGTFGKVLCLCGSVGYILRHPQLSLWTITTLAVVAFGLVEALFMNSVFLKINDVSFIFWLALGALMLETEDKVPAAERTL